MAREHQAQRGISRDEGARGDIQGFDTGAKPSNEGGGVVSADGAFAVMRRLSDSMDRLFSSFFASSGLEVDRDDAFASQNDVTEASLWPELEVRQSGDKFLLHAVIPGIKKEDINVEVRDHKLSIAVERRSHSAMNEEPARTGRSPSVFCRTIALPKGARVDSASATFEDGVLRIELEVPTSPESSRRIEVRDGSPP